MEDNERRNLMEVYVEGNQCHVNVTIDGNGDAERLVRGIAKVIINEPDFGMALFSVLKEEMLKKLLGMDKDETVVDVESTEMDELIRKYNGGKEEDNN